VPSRKGSQYIASVVRGAFVRACKSLEDDGRPLSTIIEGLLREKPAEALNAVAKFVPKEMLIETTIVDQLQDMSDEALEDAIGRLAAQASVAALTASKAGATEH